MTGNSLDIEAYLGRIGYVGAREPTRALLAALVLRHVHAIAFENIDAFVGRRVSLDVADVERKLVGQQRGGWCFEQNLLFGEALRALGFAVTDLTARVLWGRPAGAITARTHRLLVVHIEGRDWLVDVGFGGQTLTGVLDLHSEAAQATPHEPFRLRRLQGEERVLESQIGGEWLPLCRFDLQPQLPIDFEAANYQLAHDPASFFTQGLRVSRVSAEGRHRLLGGELTLIASDGGVQRQQLRDPDAVLAALRAPFGIDVEAIPELRERIVTTSYPISSQAVSVQKVV